MSSRIDSAKPSGATPLRPSHCLAGSGPLPLMRPRVATGSEDSTSSGRASANRSISRFRVWTKEGLISRKTGQTRFRILLRLKALRALVASSRQDRPCSAAKASISARVIPRRGRRRGMSLNSGSGMNPSAFIPRRPRMPVPRRRFRRSVSALSLALCATATPE